MIERQITTVTDAGMVERGQALPSKIADFMAFIVFGANAVPDPDFKPGEGASRLCLSLAGSDGSRHYRQFLLEVIDQNPVAREVQLHLVVSQILLPEECRQPRLDLLTKRELDTNFWAGLFDFPMIDNTRLSDNERAAVSITALNKDVLSVALAYFPGSRASLKDKPYYDEVINGLVKQNRTGVVSPLK